MNCGHKGIGGTFWGESLSFQRMVKGADDPENDADESSIPSEAESRQAIEQSQFAPELIEHMVRCWDSERDNAERLTRKVNIIVSVLALLFGSGIVQDRMDL